MSHKQKKDSVLRYLQKYPPGLKFIIYSTLKKFCSTSEKRSTLNEHGLLIGICFVRRAILFEIGDWQWG